MKGQIVSQPQRIAFFLPSLAGGGAERVIVTLANAMVQRDLTVDLLLSSKSGPYLEELDPRINVHDLGAGRVITSIRPLRHYIRQQKPAVLLSSLMHANVAAAIACILARRPLRFLIREANSIGVKDHYSSLKSMVKVGLARWAYRQADMLIGVSQGSLALMFEALDLPDQHPSRVILNPVIDDKFAAKARAEPSPSWPWDDGLPVVLGVGRLVPQKDFSTLIHAFARVRQRASARLIILGEGEERSKLEQLALELGVSDDLWMPGFVINPFAHMKRASVYVLSSRWEGLPNTLIQAMACGTPVVATRCPSGPDEILEDGRWGALVPVGDAEAMACAILNSINGKAGIRPGEVLHRYDVSHVTQQYLDAMLG
ncbi:glycosyl transferase [Microvirga sp. KLBC 81]|uniref:glycosyltransferase n=1 Tax=Microvirga sp. KLBC 81 TaxID=1862707 RepID=UPI000D522162|nr:glycosyltransferase [Microvirga sp. KLBC 81]PVE20346.1 glycosyl transferase [Microvirga sp. KLBC 81]